MQETNDAGETVFLQFRVSSDFKRRFKNAAHQERKNMSEFIRYLLEQYEQKEL